MRYFKPLRIQLYRRIFRAIQRIAPELTVYFCMEDDEVWQKSFGFTPSDRGGLPEMLDRSAVTHCRLAG
jgi:spore photoproduct lyase